MSSFNLFTSNRMEHLVDLLAQTVSTPLSSPFAKEIIVIQNRGMQRWLSMQLATRLGIWAHCDYPFPNAFVSDIFAKCMPSQPGQISFDPEIMVWKIIKTLPTLIDKEPFAPLKSYVADSNPLKLFQLSQKIGDQFDQYTVYRPEMTLKWELGEENHWQAELWRTLNTENTMHRAQLKKQFQQAVSQGQIKAELLPARISVFGISALPIYHIEIFQTLSSIIDVNFYHLNPSAEFWDDILSEKEIRKFLKKQRKIKKRNVSAHNLHLETGHSLLSSLGQYGRDFLARLHESISEETNQFVDPDTTTLLSSIQSDILHLREPGSQDFKPTPLDQSIQINSCHGPMREVEVLYDFLLDLFNKDPNLHPSNIVVMTPDIETYAPYIDAIFGSPEDKKRKIPYSLADRNLCAESTIPTAFLSLLELPGSRFNVTAIMEILQIPEIQAAFNIDSDQLSQMKNWIISTGIRWGIDQNSREKLHLPPMTENTWRSGIDSMLLGYALPSAGKNSFCNIAGYDHIEGSQCETLCNLIDFFDCLVEYSQKMEGSYSLEQWSELLIALLHRFFKPSHEKQQEFLTIHTLLIELSSIQELSGFDSVLPIDVIKATVTSKLAERNFMPGFITGAVTFCAMLPMRSIPFKIVAVLGLNNDAFPRKSIHTSWDLIAAHPMKGDRSLELEDRYLFLEALLSARDIFYISYSGQNPHGNSSRRPSVLVEELLDYIYRYMPEGYQPLFETNTQQTDELKLVTSLITNSCSKLGRDNIITEHRLQAFSPAYFIKNSNLFTYSIENLQAAQKTGIKGEMEVPFFKDSLPDPPDTFKTIQIKDLCNFYNNPCRYLLQKRLGLSLDVVSEEVSDDEPFDLKGLSGYSIAEKLIENSIDGIPYNKSYQQFKMSGFLPHGSVGAYHFDNLQSGTSGFVEKLSGYLDDDPLENLRVDYQLEDFHLTGTINRIWKNNLVHFRYAKVKPTDMLHIWIKHLVLNACRQPQYPSRSLLFSRDGSWGYSEIPNAAELLLKLLSFYLEGLSQPQQFLPASSWEYADTIINKKKTEDIAIDNALKRWRGNDFSSVPGESTDPYVSLCYRSATPFGEQFPINSTDIYGPLIQHMEILG